MSEKRAIGLEYIKVGDIAEDGDMGTVLAALGVTYKDTAELTQADHEETIHESEENDDPEEIITKRGKKTLKWSIMNYDPTTLVKVLGGTVTGVAPNEVWNEPDTTPDIEQSIEYKSKNGVITRIPRSKVVGKLNWKLSQKGVALVDITATIMTPTKAGVKRLQIGRPVVV